LIQSFDTCSESASPLQEMTVRASFKKAKLGFSNRDKAIIVYKL
jgi:hypothetical protein